MTTTRYARITKWTPERVIEGALKAQERRMAKAVLIVKALVLRKINRGNRTGTNPSAPGEPPKKVSAWLFRSISTLVLRRGRFVIGVIGSDSNMAPYNRRLELGFYGADKRGRNYRQAPRPYLRPSLAESRPAVAKILGVSK